MQRIARGLVQRLKNRLEWYHHTAVSTDYALLEETQPDGLDGWQTKLVAENQHHAFAPLLESARIGKPRRDFVVAADAIIATGVVDPLVVEIGCGSGYYSELLTLLSGKSIHYMGLDYAASMIELAHRNYPGVPFVTGDACRLPLRTASCDILLSGTSLMHIVDYKQAIAESIRVAGQWCIFHTVPVMAERTTTLLRKNAYGQAVAEVIFNKYELEALFTGQGLVIQKVLTSIPYDVSAIVGEKTWTLTYLCRKEV